MTLEVPNSSWSKTKCFMEKTGLTFKIQDIINVKTSHGQLGVLEKTTMPLYLYLAENFTSSGILQNTCSETEIRNESTELVNSNLKTRTSENKLLKNTGTRIYIDSSKLKLRNILRLQLDSNSRPLWIPRYNCSASLKPHIAFGKV